MPESRRSGAPERVSVIGLGRFGRSLAKTLHELGYEVTAIDLNEKLVQDVRHRSQAERVVQQGQSCFVQVSDREQRGFSSGGKAGERLAHPFQKGCHFLKTGGGSRQGQAIDPADGRRHLEKVDRFR